MIKFPLGKKNYTHTLPSWYKYHHWWRIYPSYRLNVDPCEQATLYHLLEHVKFLKSIARKIFFFFFQICLHVLLNSLLLSVCFFSCKLLRYTQHCRSHVKHTYPGSCLLLGTETVHVTTRLPYISRILGQFSVSSENECEAVFWMSDLFCINPIKGKQHRSTPLQWSSYTNQTLTESLTNTGLEMTSNYWVLLSFTSSNLLLTKILNLHRERTSHRTWGNLLWSIQYIVHFGTQCVQSIFFFFNKELFDLTSLFTQLYLICHMIHIK